MTIERQPFSKRSLDLLNDITAVAFSDRHRIRIPFAPERNPRLSHAFVTACGLFLMVKGGLDQDPEAFILGKTLCVLSAPDFMTPNEFNALVGVVDRGTQRIAQVRSGLSNFINNSS